MKRMLLPPIFVLAALLAFSLWNIRHMEGETDRWREQLQAADRLALSGAVSYKHLLRLRHHLRRLSQRPDRRPEGQPPYHRLR